MAILILVKLELERLRTTFFIMTGTSTPNREKLPQYKFIHVQYAKQITRVLVSPVTQAQKGRFCASNGSLTHREEGFAKQTQVMLQAAS